MFYSKTSLCECVITQPCHIRQGRLTKLSVQVDQLTNLSFSDGGHKLFRHICDTVNIEIWRFRPKQIARELSTWIGLSCQWAASEGVIQRYQCRFFHLIHSFFSSSSFSGKRHSRKERWCLNEKNASAQLWQYNMLSSFLHITYTNAM